MFISDCMDAQRTEGSGVSFDRIADSYDESRGYPDIVTEDILRVMSTVLSRDGTILDLGTGTGRLARPLQGRGFDIVGLDIAERMLKKAQGKGIVNLLRGDACFMPFRDQVFDTTLSVHVLHLIPNWRIALKEIARVTRSSLVSLISDKGRSPAQEIRRAYERFCEEVGCPVCPPGLRERELQEMLSPDHVKRVVVNIHSLDVQGIIERLDNRLLSTQWAIPDDVHTKAIERLKAQYRGVVRLPEVDRISVVVWNAGRLRDFVSTKGGQRELTVT